MARGAINISVTGDYNDRDINRAIRDLERLKTQSATTSPAMAGLGRSFAAAGAALAGMVGIQQITQFLKDSAQAAIEDEKSMRSLAQAMTNVGLSGQLPEIEEGIDRLSRMNGIADDKLRPAFQQLALVTEDVTKSQKLLSLAMDISAGTGRDLESVTMGLAKAAGGQTTALGRLGVGLDAALLKSKDMDAITAELSRKFGGQAAAAADTYGGRIARISVAVDEAKEKIGFALLDALNNVSNAMGGTNGVVQAVDEFSNGVAGLIRDTSTLASRLLGLANATDSYRQRDKFSQDTFRQWTQLIPIVGTYLSIWSTNNENAARAAEKNATAHGTTKVALSATAIAASRAAANIRDLASATAEAAEAAYTAAGSYMAFWQSVLDQQRVARDLKNTSGTVSSAIAEGLAMGDTGEAFWDRIRGNIDKAAKSGGGSAVAETISRQMAKALAEANAIVQNAGASPMMQSFNVTKAIFGKIAEDYGPAKDAVRGLFDQAFSVLAEKIEAARQIGQQVADGLTGQLSLASALEKAKETGGSIVDAFIDQGAKIQAFAGNLQKLLNAGLSKQAFDEIVSAGYQRGADIADALLTGNVNENVRRANEVYTSVNNIALQTGNQAAAAFGQVGIQMAIDMMQALIDALTGKKGKAYRTLQEAMDSLAASLYRKTFIDIETRNIGGGGGGAATPSAPVFDRPLPPISGSALGQYAPQGPGLGPNIPSGEGRIFAELSAMANYRRAAGGPVSAGQPYIVGEIGPELFVPGRSGTIIPNNQLGGGSTYNITVQAGVGDPREIGRQVVEAIKSFERASGPVFVNA